MKPRILFISLIVCLSYSLTYAQPDFVWAKSLGGGSGSTDIGYSVAVDENGNIITTGEFWGTGDFDPGTGTYNLVSAGNHDIFVSKLDSAGNFVWAKSIGGTSADYGYAITTDKSGNIYVTGVFYQTVDFDPGAGTYELTAAGSGDVFVLKLDSLGNFLWVHRMGGANTDIGYSIAVDTIGNVYTAGWFKLTADFNPDAGNFYLTSAGGEDAFLCKLNSAGNFVWAKKMGGQNNDRARSVVVDAYGNAHTSGYFMGISDFDPGTATYNLVSNGLEDVFVSKLDSSGNFLWAAGMGGSFTEWSFGVALDSMGNVYTSGNFSDTVDFDPGLDTFNLISAGNEDVFVSKLNAQGNFVWAVKIGGAFGEMSRTIKVDGNKAVHLTGNFSGTVDFDPGPDVFSLSAPNGAVFVTTLDSTGEFVCAGNIGPSYCHSTALDNKGYLYLTGDYSGTSDFDPSTGVSNLTSVTGSTDAYIVKLLACVPCATTYSDTLLSVCDSLISPSGIYNWTVSGTYNDTIQNFGGCDSVMTFYLTVGNASSSSINITACNDYTVPSGDETYAMGGIYADTIPNASGCDSIITINLTVNSVDISLTVGSTSLTSNASGVNFQWLDCDNNYAIIPSETNMSFFPSSTGNYAVQVIDMACTDTSSCHSFTITGVNNDLISDSGIDVSPNPSSDKITISGIEKIKSISIYNLFGQLVFNKINLNQIASDNIDLTDYQDGIYFIEFFDGVNSSIKKLVINKNR